MYKPWAALGGMGYIAGHLVMLRQKLDDPLDAVAAHGAGGLVGIISVPWFMYISLERLPKS